MRSCGQIPMKSVLGKSLKNDSVKFNVGGKIIPKSKKEFTSKRNTNYIFNKTVQTNNVKANCTSIYSKCPLKINFTQVRDDNMLYSLVNSLKYLDKVDQNINSNLNKAYEELYHIPYGVN